MLDFKLFKNARWSELYQFFESGEPPLIWRLLAINTIVLMLVMVRRARGKAPLRASTVYFLQGLLITANLTVMFAPYTAGFRRLLEHVI